VKAKKSTYNALISCVCIQAIFLFFITAFLFEKHLESEQPAAATSGNVPLLKGLNISTPSRPATRTVARNRLPPATASLKEEEPEAEKTFGADGDDDDEDSLAGIWGTVMRPGWGLNGSNIDDDEGTGVQSKKSRVRYAKYSRIDGVCPEPSSSSNDKKKAEVPSFATSTGAFWGLPEPLVPTAAQKAVVRRRDGSRTFCSSWRTICVPSSVRTDDRRCSRRTLTVSPPRPSSSTALTCRRSLATRRGTAS